MSSPPPVQACPFNPLTFLTFSIGFAWRLVSLTRVYLHWLCRCAFGNGELAAPDYDNVPSAVFCQPPLASGKAMLDTKGETILYCYLSCSTSCSASKKAPLTMANMGGP